MIAGDRVERRARGAGKKGHFFGGFRGTLRSRAHAGNGGTVGGVGKVIRARRLLASQKTSKCRRRRGITTSDNVKLSDVFLKRLK